MSDYMLISSRDPFEYGDADNLYRAATVLRTAGHDVTLFLVQNGVLAGRVGADNRSLRDVIRAGVRVLADSFSLRERGVDASRLVPGIEAAPLDAVIDALAAGARTLWH